MTVFSKPSDLKGNLFTVNATNNLITRRFERLKNVTRIPIDITLKLLWYYIKRVFKVRGTAGEIADNYYFLTLINCDAHSIKVSKRHYIFRNSAGTKFLARKSPSSDLEVFNQVWGRDEYKKAAGLIEAKIDDNIVIVDVGANVGYTSLFFSQYFPKAKILSIEPDDENYLMLKDNIELNNTGNIISSKTGIWSHRCNLSVIKSFRDGREWALQVEEVSYDTGLRGMHLSDIIDEFAIDKIDILKIDIEGAEKYLFEDKDKASEFLSRTKILAIEIHDEEVSREYIYDILKENEFSYFEYSDLTIAHRQ